MLLSCRRYGPFRTCITDVLIDVLIPLISQDKHSHIKSHDSVFILMPGLKGDSDFCVQCISPLGTKKNKIKK